MQRNNRRRATLKNTSGPRGGQYAKKTVTKKGSNGGMWRVTETRRKSDNRVTSSKRVYLGAA